MQITYLGYFVIPMGILLFLLRPMYLLYGTIFISTFTASSILNIPNSKTGIQPVYYIGSLWFLYLIIEYFKKMIKENKIIINFKLSKIRKQFLIAIVVFAVIVFISIVMMMIPKNVQVVSPINRKLQTVKFTSFNITQYIYLIFMLFSSISVIFTVKTKKNFDNCIKAFMLSTLFSVVWGIFQFCAFYLKIRYPHEVFNNNISYSQQYKQMIYGIKRVTSIAVEPSMYALHMLMAISIILALWLVKYRVFKNKIVNNIFLSLLLLFSVLVLILTTSTTAYLILSILILLVNIYVLLFNRKRDNELNKNKRRIYILNSLIAISIIGIFACCIYVFRIYWGTVYDMLKDITVNKLEVESGKARTTAITSSLGIFKQYPIFGVGWASHRSLDLTTNILVNTGLLGFIAFATIVILPIKKLFRSIKNDDGNQGLKLGLAFSILCGVLSLGISIPDLTFVYFWVILALGICILDLDDEIAIN